MRIGHLGVALMLCGCAAAPPPPACPPPPPSALCKWYPDVRPFIPAIQWLLSANPRVVADLQDAVATECGTTMLRGK